MKESPYITWAKAHHDLRYSLAGSGVRPCPTELLAPPPEPFPLSGPGGPVSITKRIRGTVRLVSATLVLRMTRRAAPG